MRFTVKLVRCPSPLRLRCPPGPVDLPAGTVRMYFSVDGQGDRAEQSLELPVSDALTAHSG
jgi:hypothetical protein